MTSVRTAMASLTLLLAALSMPSAWALDARDVLGGWEATVDGTEHIYDFEIQGHRITGVYCTDCADANTVAFVDGTLDSDRMRFVVNHVRDDGTIAYQDHVTASIEVDGLAVRGEAGGPHGGAFSWVMHKDPRGPGPVGGLAVPAVLPQRSAPAKNAAAYGSRGQIQPAGFQPGGGGAFFGSPPYKSAGHWEQISADSLVGVWYFGTGADKQNFIFRKVGDRLLGMVCGPCDNPYSAAILDNFRIQGDTLIFNLHHEDCGSGPLPYTKRMVAHLARNELRVVSSIADNLPLAQQPYAYLAFSMVGPVPIEATAAR